MSERGSTVVNVAKVGTHYGEPSHTSIKKPNHHMTVNHNIYLIVIAVSLPQFTITIYHIVWSMARCGGE